MNECKFIGQRITIGFGVGEDRNGQHIKYDKRTRALHAIKRVACEVSGGYTLIKCEGGWFNDDNDIVEEPACSLIGYYKDINAWRHVADTILSELSQQAVIVEVNGFAYEYRG